MSPTPDATEISPEAHAQTCKILAGALIAGVLVFLALSVFLRISRGGPLFAPDSWDLLHPKMRIPLVGLVMAIGAITAAFVVPGTTVTTMRKAIAADKTGGPRPSDESALRGAYQTKTIVLMALLEGAAFFNLIGFLLAGSLPSVLATLVLLSLMVSQFPSRGRIDDFVAEQAERLRVERQIA